MSRPPGRKYVPDDRLWRPESGFGAFLKKQRERSNLSMRKVAERMACSHTWIGEMEKATLRQPPDIGFLRRLAAVYDVSSDVMERQAGYGDYSKPIGELELRIADLTAALQQARDVIDRVLGSSR